MRYGSLLHRHSCREEVSGPIVRLHMPHFYDDQCRRAQEGTVNTLLNADLQRMAINLLEDAQLLLLGYGIPRETAIGRVADAQRLVAAVEVVSPGERMQGVTSTPASSSGDIPRTPGRRPSPLPRTSTPASSSGDIPRTPPPLPRTPDGPPPHKRVKREVLDDQ